MARKRAQNAFNVRMVLAALVGGVIAAVIYMVYDVAIENQLSSNRYLTTENARLDDQIKNVAGLKGEIAALKARQQAVESLQTNRNLPVHLLNDTAQLLPNGMYLNGMKQEGQDILFTGVAQSQEQVSELLRQLSSSNSQWLTQPELIEIKSDQLTLNPRDQRRVYDFTVRAMLGQASQAASAQQAASKKTNKGGA
jgi:type IV pilus assembly protein PilN